MASGLICKILAPRHFPRLSRKKVRLLRRSFISRCIPSSSVMTLANLSFQSVPLPLRAMLNEYFQLGSRISKHYLSPGVILCLVTGRFVPPIHRKNLYSLQYSMLPAQRVGFTELWRQLTEKDQTAASFPELVGLNGHARKGSNGLPRRGFRRTGTD